jgi:hypothetical protein
MQVNIILALTCLTLSTKIHSTNELGRFSYEPKVMVEPIDSDTLGENPSILHTFELEIDGVPATFRLEVGCSYFAGQPDLFLIHKQLELSGLPGALEGLKNALSLSVPVVPGIPCLVVTELGGEIRFYYYRVNSMEPGTKISLQILSDIFSENETKEYLNSRAVRLMKNILIALSGWYRGGIPLRKDTIEELLAD